MEDITKQEKLAEEFIVLHTLTHENPCGMNPSLLHSLTDVLHRFVGRYCIESASKDQVAIYLQRDVRTITRWQKQYQDSPKPRHNGHHEVSYEWTEIVRWKLKHSELFK